MSKLDDPTIKAIIAQCYLDTKIFSKTMFPERFTRPFAGITNEIFEVLDDSAIQQVVIKAPRGWGKTSIVNMSYPAKHILFQSKKFIVPISCTATQAVLQSENLKFELLSNERIKKFGFQPIRSEVFAKDLWKTSTGTMVLPRGAGQQVRGFLSGNYRPDLILVDDLEDSESVKNPELRKKLREWFFADVVNAVDRSSKEWKIVVVGTVLHEDAFVVNLANDPSWHEVHLELCDDNYNSYYPEFMSTDSIKELAENYARRGELHIFFMEYRNSVIPADAIFQNKYFQYYAEDRSMTFDRDVDNVVIADPAKTTNMSSDYSAILGIGVNLEMHNQEYKKNPSIERPSGIYIRDVVNQRFHPEEFFEEVYQMSLRMGTHVIGVEITGLDEYMTYPITNYMLQKHNFSPEFIWLKSPGGPKNQGAKEKRVKGLAPFYRQGLVYHNKVACGSLEAQLLAFPRSKHWDVMDAAGYVIEMLDLSDRYMSADPDQSPEAIDQELEELWENDLPNDWRMI